MIKCRIFTELGNDEQQREPPNAFRSFTQVRVALRRRAAKTAVHLIAGLSLGIGVAASTTANPKRRSAAFHDHNTLWSADAV